MKPVMVNMSLTIKVIDKTPCRRYQSPNGLSSPLLQKNTFSLGPKPLTHSKLM
jgi:hypothetical protein